MFLEEKMVDKVKNVLEKNYFEKDKDGFYFQDISADYRDVLSEETIKNIVNSEDPICEFNNFFNEWDVSYEYEELFKLLRSELGETLYETNEDDMENWICENVYFNPPYEHYERQEVLVNIIVDTRDGNYDYTLNNFLNYCAPKVEDLKIDNKSSILWLVKQQGYTKKDLMNVIKFEYDKENKFLNSLNSELLNSTSSMNALVFSIKMELKELIDFLDNPEDITLDKNTSCGLVDFWNGAGSVLEISLDKNIVIPKQYARMTVDGSVGYSIQEIYGMCPSFWTESVFVTAA